MEAKVVPYSRPSPEEFQNILDNLFPQSDENTTPDEMMKVKENQSKIFYMLSYQLCDLFGCCSFTIQQPNATKKIIFNALIILKEALKTNPTSLNKVRNVWLSKDFAEVRSVTKYSFVLCIGSEFENIRAQAAHCIAYLLIIEQEEWKDLAPFLIEKLYSQESSNYLKSGIVSTFIEIFSTDFLFSSQMKNVSNLFNNLPNFFMFLVNQISYPGLDQYKYLQCAQCLYLMLCKIPNFFLVNFEQSTKMILDTLQTAFPYADLNLYRKFHNIMLQLFINNYKTSDTFMKRIFDFTAKGISSNFRYVSIDFWHSVYKFEKHERSGLEKFLITRKVSISLSEVYLKILLNINEPEKTEYLKYENDTTIYTCRVLTNFVKASLKANDPENFAANKCVDFIEYHLKQEPTMPIVLAILNALSAICQRESTDELTKFFKMQFPFIIECCHNQYSRISVNALFLLNKFICKQKLISSYQDYSTKIFQVVKDLIPSKNDKIIEQIIKLVAQYCESLHMGAKVLYYQNFIEIYNLLRSDQYIFNSEFVGKPYAILAKYFDSLLKHDVPTFENDEYKKTYDYDNNLVKLKDEAKLLLDQNLKALYDSFNLMIDTCQVLQSDIFTLIRSLIYFLKAEANDYIDKTMELMFMIVRHQKQCLENVYLIFWCIFDTNLNKISKYVPHILESIKVGFDTQSPITIGEAAYLIGLLFKKLGPNINQDLEPSLKNLFVLLNDSHVDNKRDYYAKVIIAIGNAISGIGKNFPIEARDVYAQKLIALSKLPVNNENQAEKEELEKVFDAVAFGFQVLFKEFKDDINFLNHFKDGPQKSIICNFLKHVYINRAFSPEIIQNYLNLIDQFISTTNSKFNIQINNGNIKGLVKEAKEIYKLKKKNKEYNDATILLGKIEKS